MPPRICYINRHTQSGMSPLCHYPASLAVSLSLLLPLSLHYLLLLLKDRLNVTSVPSPHPRANLMSLHGATPAYLVNCYFPLVSSFPPLYETMWKPKCVCKCPSFPLKLMRLKCIPNITWKYHIRQHRHTPRGKEINKKTYYSEFHMDRKHKNTRKYTFILCATWILTYTLTCKHSWACRPRFPALIPTARHQNIAWINQ